MIRGEPGIRTSRRAALAILNKRPLSGDNRNLQQVACGR